MSGIEKYPVLDHIVNTLKAAIADAKVENQSPSEYTIMDGNDEIRLKQDTINKDAATILITDERRIIFSEDLMETLQHMHKDFKGDNKLKAALETATVIINDLDIETEQVFQAVKDFLDQLSNSYEFHKNVNNKITQLDVIFKFGKHVFGVNINNEPAQISIQPAFASTFDTTVQKTILEDLSKVEQAVNKMFKGQ